MYTTDRPANIFFDTLDTDFSVDMHDVCEILLTDKPTPWFSRGDVVPRELAKDRVRRDRLHKKIKDKMPGEQPLEVFVPFGESVPRLLSLIEDKVIAGTYAYDGRATDVANAAIVQVADEIEARDRVGRVVYDTVVLAAPAMKWSLQVYTRGSDFYDNLMDGIRTQDFRSEWERAVAALILFAAAGLLGDPLVFGPIVEQSIEQYCGVDVLEPAPLGLEPLDDDGMGRFETPVMGLQRLLDGRVRGRRHTLDRDGTLIGSMPITDGDYVADVDRSVSKEHLFIYEEDGHWYARGLHSKHGTFILRDGDELIVELPKSYEEPQGGTRELLPGDVLVLGSTEYEVQMFQLGE